jgi:mannose-6-phosphate isomerase
MACSDNVIRAGLTPKFKDIATLCSLLKYDCKAPKDLLFKGHKSSDDSYVTVFNPPVEDFSVHQIQLPKDIHKYVIRPINGASILIVIEGNGEAANESLGPTNLHLERGSVVFLAANESLTLHVKSSDQQMVIYRACCDGSV